MGKRGEILEEEERCGGVSESGGKKLRVSAEEGDSI